MVSLFLFNTNLGENMKFEELNLPLYIMEGLNKQGFEKPTDIQEKCIPLIMNGEDVIGKSETGSGKTYAYGIPAIINTKTDEKGVNVIVLCPTRELASQVSDEIKKLIDTKRNCKVALIVGGNSFDRQLISLKNKDTKIVIGTPGRIMDHLRRRTLKLNEINMVVLDEADEMLNMGFKDDIETILKSTKTDHQTVMFSATMPKPILELTKNFMKNPQMVELSNANDTSKMIKQYYVNVENKREAMQTLLNIFNPGISMVFCNTKRMVDDVTKFLRMVGYSAAALHGDMRQRERRETMASFKSGITSILVATDVAARGIDVKDIELILNYDLPLDIEYYIHRIGRTGRAGKTGIAITLVNSKQQQRQIDVISRTTNTDLEEYKLEGMESFSLSREDKRTRGGRSFSKKSETRNRTERSFGNKNSNRTLGRGKESNTGEDFRSYKKRNYKTDEEQSKKSLFFARKTNRRELDLNDKKRTARIFGERKSLGKNTYDVNSESTNNFAKVRKSGKSKFPIQKRLNKDSGPRKFSKTSYRDKGVVADGQRSATKSEKGSFKMERPSDKNSKYDYDTKSSTLRKSKHSSNSYASPKSGFTSKSKGFKKTGSEEKSKPRSLNKKAFKKK